MFATFLNKNLYLSGSLQLRLSSGRQYFWESTYTKCTTEISTVTERPLAYLSGRKVEADGTNYYQLIFQSEGSGPCRAETK